MDLRTLPIAFADKRGEIIDVLQREPIEYATIIHSRKDSVRANHYHKETWQWLYVLSGKLRTVSQMPGQNGSVTREIVVGHLETAAKLALLVG